MELLTELQIFLTQFYPKKIATFGEQMLKIQSYMAGFETELHLCRQIFPQNNLIWQNCVFSHVFLPQPSDLFRQIYRPYHFATLTVDDRGSSSAFLAWEPF